MMRVVRWLWPSHPPRDQATLDGLRLVQEIAEQQIAGKPVSRTKIQQAQALLDVMPSYEELYARTPPAFEDWFTGF